MRKSGGYSLIELTITVGVMSVAFGVAVSLYMGVSKVYDMQSARADAAREARLFASRLKADIRQASAIERVDSSTLVLKTASTDREWRPIPGAYDTIIYSLKEGTLIRTIRPAPGSSRVRAEGRSCPAGKVRFEREGARTVLVSFSSDTKVHRRRMPTATVMRASLRN